MANNFRKSMPMQLVNRMLCLQALKEIGADKISQLDLQYSVFLVKYEDGSFDIDWEFAIFESTDYQLSNLIDNFQAKPIEQRAKDTVKEVLGDRFKDDASTGIIVDTDISAAKEFAKREENNFKIIKGQ